MRLGAGVDRSTDLGYPQPNSVVRQHRESERELRPIERAGGLPDHDSIKATATRRDVIKQT